MVYNFDRSRHEILPSVCLANSDRCSCQDVRLRLFPANDSATLGSLPAALKFFHRLALLVLSVMHVKATSKLISPPRSLEVGKIFTAGVKPSMKVASRLVSGDDDCPSPLKSYLSSL